MSVTTPRLAIVGAGSVARALVAALSADPCEGDAVVLWARNRAAAESAAALGRASVARDLADLCSCETILVAVTDTAIEEVAAALLEGGAVGSGASQTVLHTGGALTGEEALAALAQTGATLGSLHPLVAVPRGDLPSTTLAKSFVDMPFAIEATMPSGVAVAAELVRMMGGFEVSLPAAGSAEEARLLKARYHAAATMVATGVVALVDRAAATLAGAGAPGTANQDRSAYRRAYAALASSAAKNVGQADGADVLTGALARGDEDLIALHRSVLEGTPSTETLYAAIESAARQMLADADRDENP